MTQLLRIPIKKLIVLFTSTCLTIPVMAANGHVYIGGILGASVASLSQSNPQISYYNNSLLDAYPLNDNVATVPFLGINGGYEFAGANCIPAIAVGLGFYSGTNGYNFKGQVIETALGDPSSLLYNYKYKLSSARLMAETQLTWQTGLLTPFINFGLGTAWNQLKNYQETPVNSTGFVALPPFNSHTNTNFSYQIGVGVSYAFNYTKPYFCFKQERISVGYRYVDLGTASFQTRGSSYPYQISMGKVTSNEFYLTYTHLF